MKKNLLLIVSTVAFVTAIVILDSVLSIGNKIGNATHVYVEYAFYLIILLLITAYIIRPVLKVCYTPEIPVLTVNENADMKQLYKFAYRLANNCSYIKNSELSVQHSNAFKNAIKINRNDKALLIKEISQEIDRRIKGDKLLRVDGINKMIYDAGKASFAYTSVSQDGKLDAVLLLIVNCKLIYDIVRASGFRPSFIQLSKLYIEVLGMILLTYSDVLSNVAKGTGNFVAGLLQGVPLLGGVLNTITKSVVDGGFNALMTLRIGYATRSYLINGAKNLKKEEILRNAEEDLKRIKGKEKQPIDNTTDESYKTGTSWGNRVSQSVKNFFAGSNN